MKKLISIVILTFAMMVSSVSANCNSCPVCEGACTGICTGVYDSNGTISHYLCVTGGTGEKNCSATTSGGSGTDESI